MTPEKEAPEVKRRPVKPAQVKAAKESTVRPLEKPAAQSEGVTKKSTKNFPGKLSAFHKKIAVHFETQGAMITESNKTTLVAVTSNHTKVKVKLEQKNKQVVVLIVATAGTKAAALDEIDNILECCTIK